MAFEMFLKLAGIEGESTDAKHKGEIDVLAWSWGLSNPVTVSGGAGAGRANIQDLSIAKAVDLASPLLVTYCATGKHISDGSLAIVKAGGHGEDFLVFNMADIVVNSVSEGGSNGDNQLTENVSLAFSKWQFDYQPTKADGTTGPVTSTGWNITTNKPA